MTERTIIFFFSLLGDSVESEVCHEWPMRDHGCDGRARLKNLHSVNGCDLEGVHIYPKTILSEDGCSMINWHDRWNISHICWMCSMYSYRERTHRKQLERGGPYKIMKDIGKNLLSNQTRQVRYKC